MLRSLGSGNKRLRSRFRASTRSVPHTLSLSTATCLKQEVATNNFKAKPMTSVLPLPLPSPALTPFAQYALYPSSHVNEQVAVIEACLGGGHLARAKNVWNRLRKLHENDHQQGGQVRGHNLPKLHQIVPPSIHASFLRAFYRDALSSQTKSASIREAWTWWTMLVDEGDLVGYPRAEAFAVMLKGAISTIKEEVTNVDQTYNIAALLSLLPKYDLSLALVLTNDIFSSSAPAALGPLSVEEVLDYLDGILSETGLPRDVIQKARIELSALEAPVAEVQEPRPDPLEGVSTIDPTMKPALDNSEGPDDSAVPGRLDSLRSHLSSITGQRTTSTDQQLRQRFLEESAYDAARLQIRSELASMTRTMENNLALAHDDIKSLVYKWNQILKERIDDRIANPPPARVGSVHEWDFIALVPSERSAYVTIFELLKQQSGSSTVHDGVTIASACINIGKLIEREYQAQEIQKRDSERYKRNMDLAKTGMLGPGGPTAELRRMWKKEMDRVEQEEKNDDGLKGWTQIIRVRVGASLIATLIDLATLTRKVTVTETDENGDPRSVTHTDEQPAFFHSYQYVKGTKLGVVKMNPSLVERLDRDPLAAAIHPRHLPMVIPPRIWTDWNNGCYIVHKAEVMRIRDSPEQTQYIKKASDNRELDDVFAALDVLGSTAWTINRPIYDVISQVWNSGENIAGMPVKDPLLTIKDPPRPPNADEDIAVRTEYRRLLKETEMHRRNQHGERCTTNYKLEIARAYIGETFYFPHNLDFRGRTYPIPPHLSHIGDDVSRGLLHFAEAKPVGISGLKWMKIHLANTYGFDKQSLDDRELFATNHMDDVKDSAEDPLGGKRWWLSAEDPWQCLATCMELNAAMQLPEPHKYESCLPIHQDGTCNGLQHYAALGGDQLGAEAVNLVGGDRPSDVYGNVAKLVSAQVKADAEAGDKMASLLVGRISRKVVKQTVMTTVYGVTFIGAKRMIAKQIRDQNLVGRDDQYLAATYLTFKVLSSIGDLFAGAARIQKWFTLAAKLITKASPPEHFEQGSDPERMTPVIWTTPLGLPVVQPYRKHKRKQVKTALQTVFLEDPNTPAVVDTSAQASAFPPNYVHSLDATHMMLTAIECKKADITFASVHDSYWTHACDIDDMNKILRQAFVGLHSSPLLENLRNEMLKRYAGYRIPLKALSKVDKDVLGMGSKRSRTNKKTAKPAETATSLDDLLSEADDLEYSIGDGQSIDVPFHNIAQPGEFENDLTEEQVARLRPGRKDQPDDQSDVFDHTVLLSDVLPRLPVRGKFDVNEVNKSQYFFS